MSNKESKFHVINLWIILWTPGLPDNFFKKKMLTSRAMKRHTQKSYKESKSDRRRYMQGL